MICPYLVKAHTRITGIGYKKETPEMENGSVTVEVYNYMECKKEKCGAWHRGRCRYNEK